MYKSEMVTIALIIVGTIMFIAGMINLDKLQCYKTAEAIDVKCSSYSVMTGCIIEVDGKKIPLRNYRLMGE